MVASTHLAFMRGVNYLVGGFYVYKNKSRVMREDCYHLGIKALFVNEKGEVLLLKVNPALLNAQQSAYWDLPGGRVEKNQTIQDTLVREVKEELGVDDIRIDSQVGMFLSNIRIPAVDNDSVGLILGVFRCYMNSETDIILSTEHTEYQWFSPQEAGELLAVKYPLEFCRTISRL